MNSYYINFVVSLFSTFSFSYIYYKFSKAHKPIRFYTILIFVFGVLFLSVLRYLGFNSISTLSFFIFYPFLFYSLNPMPTKKLLFYLLLVWIYGIFFDFLAMILISLFMYIFKFNFSFPWLSEIMTIFVFISMMLVSKTKICSKIVEYLLSVYTKIEYPDLLLLSFTVIIFLIGTTLFLNLENLSISFVLSLFIILIVVTFLFLLKYKINSKENIKFINILRENNVFYMKIDDEHRIFKHNLLAKLLSIKSVSNKNARLLIDDLIKEFNSNIDFIYHIKDIPYGLNGIIYQKVYSYLNKLDIKIDNRIHYDIFNVLAPRRYNVLVEKMVISLDNALESSEKSVEKLLIIDLYEDDNKIIIEIKNTFADNISVDELGTVNYSTKRKHSGLGLFSILRNKEVDLTVKIINNMFVSKLVTYKNK